MLSDLICSISPSTVTHCELMLSSRSLLNRVVAVGLKLTKIHVLMGSGILIFFL